MIKAVRGGGGKVGYHSIYKVISKVLLPLGRKKHTCFFIRKPLFRLSLNFRNFLQN